MYNQVMLIGRLTKDPEVKTSSNDKSVCNIVLAVQRSYKNADGVYEADFIRCCLWDGIADRIGEYCHKGDLIAVKGMIQSSTYEKDGDKKYSVDIIVEKVTFLSTAKNNEIKNEEE